MAPAGKELHPRRLFCGTGLAKPPVGAPAFACLAPARVEQGQTGRQGREEDTGPRDQRPFGEKPAGGREWAAEAEDEGHDPGGFDRTVLLPAPSSLPPLSSLLPIYS